MQLSIFYICLTFINNAICRFVEVPAEKKLRDYLLSRYEWHVRPVQNYTDQLAMFARFKLERIASLDLKDQVLSLNLRIEQEWIDYKLKWNPENFDGITKIDLPSFEVWLPDIALYNTLGSFELKASSVMVSCNGLVKWRPKTVTKSFCLIEVSNYPFDIQTCNLTFGSWTLDETKLRITLADSHMAGNNLGMDLSEFYQSAEWDIISLPIPHVHDARFPCCKETFRRFLFIITIRRQATFYLVYIILPLIGLSYLSLLVFYLPTDSGEKISLCVSVLTSQLMFLLLMIDNIPVTSLAVPRLALLLIFNMIIISFSLFCTTIVLNIHYRKPTTHNIPKWVKNLRNKGTLMKVLFMKGTVERIKESQISSLSPRLPKSRQEIFQLCGESLKELDEMEKRNNKYPGHIEKAMQNIHFVQEYMSNQQEMDRESENWKILAAVMDRIFFVIFNCVFVVGMSLILKDSPALFDKRKAIRSNILNET